MARWNSFSEFVAAVRRAGVDTIIDPRLSSPKAAAPSTASQESIGGDGGYAVPPDYRTQVASKILGDGSLLGLTDLYRATSNGLTVPADANPPWSTSGPQVTLEGEGVALGQSKLAVEANALRLVKAQITLPVTDEMMADAVGLSAYLARAVPDRFTHHLNNWIVNGDGVQKPMGLLNAGAKIVQTKEGGQAAGTITLANTRSMLTRLHAASRANAVWLAHPETEPLLSALGFPHWNPSGPTPLLHGLPVLFREVCAAPGTEGDLLLWDPKGYFAAVRTYANAANDIKQDASMDVWFDQGISALRFTMRVAGMPWLEAPVTRFKTATTVSSIVSLETRA